MLQVARLNISKGMGEIPLSLLILLQCALFIFEQFFESKDVINFIQIVIDGVFVVDLYRRLRSVELKYWKQPINLFDALIVIASFSGHFLFTNTQSLTALRVIRLLRMLRILSLIPHFESIIGGVKRALKASRGVFLMLLVLVMFFSILGYLLFNQSLPNHFADPILSSYTVFSLFTVEGWNELPTLVQTGTWDYYLVRAYVIAVIVFGSFFALSLANAIFIDEMVMDNNADLEQKVDVLQATIEAQTGQIEELKRLISEKKL